jgi:hypothetical protein
MSGRATFGLDQSPDQLLNVDSDSTSVHQVRYIKPRRRPSIGYIDNRNHRLINISNKYIGRFKRFTLLTFYQLRYGTHPILPVAGCAWQRDRLVARPLTNGPDRLRSWLGVARGADARLLHVCLRVQAWKWRNNSETSGPSALQSKASYHATRVASSCANL